MRATFRSSRSGSAKHNDRSFDLDKAHHIDQNKTKSNLIQAKDIDKYKTLEQAEIARYQELFSDHIKQKQANYHNRRQYQREKDYTAEKLYNGRLTKPTETLYQIGSLQDGSVSPEILVKCFTDFILKCREQIPNFTNCVKILSYSLHTDEATPHIHERHCFYANGEPSQKKALEIMGFERPDLTKPESQYNNALMTFTNKCRDLWLQTITEHEISIEREPLQTHTRKHLTPAEFYYQQEAEIADRLTSAKQEQERAKDMIEKAKVLVKKTTQLHDSKVRERDELIR